MKKTSGSSSQLATIPSTSHYSPSTIQMFIKNLKLESKFNTFLLLIFILGSILTSSLLFQVLEQNAESEIANRAKLIVQTMNSVRDYTTNNIQPLLNDRLETDAAFIPETVPAFSATEVFQKLRKNEAYRSFFYKEATLNPTNLRDKVDSFEANLVEKFRNEAAVKELSGFRDLPSGKVFYIARPLTIKKDSCLRCHSTPDRAPKSQIATYGSENGFGWKLNEVIAAQVISVPAEEILANAQDALKVVMAVLLAVFGAILLAINYLLRRTVIQPIKNMVKTAEAVSLGDMDAEFQHQSQDEVGLLAAAFGRMKSSLQISMNLLKQLE
jgi:HAMP domain-containing protein